MADNHKWVMLRENGIHCICKRCSTIKAVEDRTGGNGSILCAIVNFGIVKDRPAAHFCRLLDKINFMAVRILRLTKSKLVG